MVVVSVLMGSLLMACSTMTKAEREAKEAEQAKMVKEALDKRHYKIDINMMYARRFGSKNVTSNWSYKIDINMMYARRFGSKNVTSNWSLEVKGDTLVSYLPYIGVAYEASFGSNSGLNFTAPISNYEDEGFKKGKRMIRLKVKNEDDLLDYQLEVMDNGSTSIDVMSRKREGISYSGQMDLE